MPNNEEPYPIPTIVLRGVFDISEGVNIVDQDVSLSVILFLSLSCYTSFMSNLPWSHDSLCHVQSLIYYISKMYLAGTIKSLSDHQPKGIHRCQQMLLIPSSSHRCYFWVVAPRVCHMGVCCKSHHPLRRNATLWGALVGTIDECVP